MTAICAARDLAWRRVRADLWHLTGLVSLGLLLGFASARPAMAWGWLTTGAGPEAASDLAPEDDAQLEAQPTAQPYPAAAQALDGDFEGARPTLGGGDAGLCLAAILGAEQRYGIPDHLLLGLGLQEAGHQSAQGLTIWPWTVNAAGEGRRFASAPEAEAFVRQKQAQGVSLIDIGCLQINLRWHPDAFNRLSEGFDPHRNVDYAARFLLSLYAETGDWWAAAGRYHSRNAEPQGVYLAALKRNHRVAQARIAEFAALAETAVDHLPQRYAFAALPPRSAAPARQPTPYRTEGAIWGADLSGVEGGRRSLYSAHDLEPILPAFLPPET